MRELSKQRMILDSLRNQAVTAFEKNDLDIFAKATQALKIELRGEGKDGRAANPKRKFRFTRCICGKRVNWMHPRCI